MNPLVDAIRSLHLSRGPSASPSRRRLRALILAPALAGLVGMSLLVSGCGGSPVSHVSQLGSTTTKTESDPSSAGSAQKTLASLLAYSHCMRSHGVATFPDPDAQGQFPPFHSDSAASKQASLSANDACKNLLRNGGNEGTPQDRQKKFAFALKVARCLRLHGFPNFPDPPGQNLTGAGIDPNATQFQAAETACENDARKALGLP